MQRIDTKWIATPAIALSLLACAATADAFWIDAWYAKCEPKIRENRLWPEQYVEADRRRAREPFEVMIRNGWRRQNLLGGHHFNEDASKLTESGKLRVQWILTQNPDAFRQVYVERSLNDGVTAARIATASDFAAKVAGGSSAPSVGDTHIISDGRPATTVDFVNTSFRENMPIPALPQLGTGGEASATE